MQLSLSVEHSGVYTPLMKFCGQCGASLRQQIPEGDNRLRYVCSACHTIHYQNPRIIAGCLPIYENKVLLCKRAIEPRLGKWTLPAGFLENGETIAEGATRETTEEANANISIIDLYTLFSVPHISQVYVFYRAELLDLTFFPGIETMETKLFKEEDIPWEELSFPSVSQTLEYYFKDRRDNSFQFHEGNIRVSYKK
jgi:ADP-ribose pyrophosphatase YjhB (NUDIX family)